MMHGSSKPVTVCEAGPVFCHCGASPATFFVVDSAGELTSQKALRTVVSAKTTPRFLERWARRGALCVYAEDWALGLFA